MKRWPWLFGVVFVLVGCSPEGTTVPRLLTREQKEDWKDARKKGQFSGFHIAAYQTQSNRWLMYGWSPTLEIGWFDGLPGLNYNLDEAEAKAAELVQGQAAVAAVVLDLFSGEKPSFVAWYYNAGEGVKRYERPPRSDLAKSLDEYVFDLQANPKRK